MLAKIIVVAAAAFGTAQAATAAAYAQCMSLCPSGCTLVVADEPRRWTGLDWSYHLCVGLHLHLQQCILQVKRDAHYNAYYSSCLL